jgi:hypothetical protein
MDAPRGTLEGVGRKYERRKWPGEGSRPSPQSPIGILGFPPPDALLQCTSKTKAKLLKRNALMQRLPGKKSLGVVKFC